MTKVQTYAEVDLENFVDNLGYSETVECFNRVLPNLSFEDQVKSAKKLLKDIKEVYEYYDDGEQSIKKLKKVLDK